MSSGAILEAVGWGPEPGLTGQDISHSPPWIWLSGEMAPGLPKTRSGKIMRRILRKIAEDDFGALGDTSTLAEPEVVDDLIENRMNRG
ncbi:MAG: hypothetical protein AAFW64_10610 [Pseudomonadota bacterium]